MAGAGLAAVIMLGTMMTALAGTGRPVCDEAMYVKLDPYGTIAESSVVKSYDLHGARQVVDYGVYGTVTNLSDYTEPVVDGNQITFDLSEQPDNDRFYFEGSLDSEEVSRQLPWELSVRYRLNGVERGLEEIAHEKGLVEIFIDIIPNPNTEDYYKNNMTLEAAAIIDMDKNLSVEAPGAQIQSIGNLKAVLFMVLPGEEQHYELRIGSDDFEFSGLSFMMVPVTLSQLDRLEDLRDTRDTVKDSVDSIGDSLDVVLDSLEGVQGGLSSTVSGLKKLDESRRVIASARDGIYVDADNALAVLKELSDRGIPFTSYVKEAQNALDDTNEGINDLNHTVQELDAQLADLGWGLRDINRDLNDVVELVNDTRHDIGSFESKLSDLRDDLQKLKDYKLAVNEKTKKLKELLAELKELKKQIEEHGDVLGITEEQKAKLLATLGKLIGELPEEGQQEIQMLIHSYSDAIEKAAGDITTAVGDVTQAGAGEASKGLDQVITLLEFLIGTIDGGVSRIDDMINSVQNTISVMEHICYNVHFNGESLENVLADTGEMADSLRMATGTGQGLLDDIDRLTAILNQYHETSQNALGDTGLLIDSAVRGTNAMYLLLSEVESSMKTAGHPLNQGAELTLGGMTDALNQALEGLAKTGVIKDAKKTVEDLVDETWNEYAGEDMTILNADSNASKVSLTSHENPEPQSIQIILRTEGTEEAEEEPEPEIDEDYHPQGSFLDRIVSIFVKIADTIKGIFS